MKRGLGWPIGITLALAAVVAANIGIVMVARGDPSFVIEPDYYARAVAWDSTLAQRARNAELGWTLAPDLRPFSAGHDATLRVHLSDASGTAIRNASIAVDALFNGRAGEILTTTMRQDAGGGYVAELPVRYAGVWELRFTVVHDGARYTRQARVEAVRDGTP